MTVREEKEVIRVCGADYDYLDIPPKIRKRDEEKAMAEDVKVEEIEAKLKA